MNKNKLNKSINEANLSEKELLDAMKEMIECLHVMICNLLKRYNDHDKV